MQGHLRAACQRLVGSPGWVPNPAITPCSLGMASKTLLYHPVGDSRLQISVSKVLLNSGRLQGPSLPLLFIPLWFAIMSQGAVWVMNSVWLRMILDFCVPLSLRSSECWITGVHRQFLCFLSPFVGLSTQSQMSFPDKSEFITSSAAHS